jgi:hypothetical protein
MNIIQEVQQRNPYIGSSILYKGQMFDYWDEGCTRYVFVDATQTKVIKIPRDDSSTHFNELEFSIYNEADEKNKKKMCPTTFENGIIEQDFCMPVKWGGIKLDPHQALFAAQCRNEVGWDANGKLVCFDLDEYMKY